ncbi:MAG: LacI family transcriptional regulator [Treponema sp.]|jgi:DNA-binding LacI/PurR family transcriptional regulator|nr:LacI family transcriptional regulator [Treponema sp.]
MKNTTIVDIAKEAGVSKATVSRVISKPYLVNEKTRSKVRAVIEKYSFVPNALAQSLAGMPTKNIGVIVDEFPNDFYIDLINGIDGVINAKNYTTQLISSYWDKERELKGIHSFLLSHVDGILMAPFSSESEATKVLKESGVPYVLVNTTSNDPSVSYVCGDSYKGGRLVAAFVKTLSQEQVIIVDVSGHSTVQERIRGFKEELGSYVPVVSYEGVKTMDSGKALVRVMVERNKIDRKKTTLFVLNDYIALGVLAGLYECDIDIPRQVSIIGYDDIKIASMCRTPLTTISQSINHMGKIAAQSLIGLIRNPAAPPDRHIIEPVLIERASTARS